MDSSLLNKYRSGNLHHLLIYFRTLPKSRNRITYRDIKQHVQIIDFGQRSKLIKEMILDGVVEQIPPDKIPAKERKAFILSQKGNELADSIAFASLRQDERVLLEMYGAFDMNIEHLFSDLFSSFLKEEQVQEAPKELILNSLKKQLPEFLLKELYHLAIRNKINPEANKRE